MIKNIRIVDVKENKMIPLSEPVFWGNEWKYVKECLDTGWVSSAGRYVNELEENIAKYCGVKYAVATINGTSALHLSLIACDVKPQDEVIVPTLTFIAPVNAVRYCGASPLFMDCDPRTLCIDSAKFIQFINDNALKKADGYTYNKNTSKRIKAIIPVHIFGHPADMEEINSVCKAHNIDVVEDATESLGSEYKGKKTGSFSKLGCFSFNGNKIITTGGGGMVVTDNKALAEKVKHLSTQAKCEGIEYYHDQLGYNYRLSNVAAAVGVAQLEKIDEIIELKRNNALRYQSAFSNVKGVDFLWELERAKSNFWFYAIKVDKEHKDALIKYLIDRKIQVRPIWKLIHTLPMYQEYQSCDIVNAIDAYESCINIPCSANISLQDIECVISNIKNYFGG